MNYPEITTELQDKTLLTIHIRLRDRNFSRGLPFLILSEKLPHGQVYHEHAGGRIELQEVYTVGSEINTRVIRTLSIIEAEKVRRENWLI
jgi:hypothetical protein